MFKNADEIEKDLAIRIAFQFLYARGIVNVRKYEFGW